MGYKQPSSGLPFKQMGSSPAKQSDLTNEVDNTRSNSEEKTKKRSNISTTKGSSVITNTDTGDTYNLKTGETTKNKANRKIRQTRAEKKAANPSAAPFKESPAKQIKEVKGTSIFGKSPKDFAVDVAKNVTGYNAFKGIYDKISGSKTKLTNNKSSNNSVSKSAIEAASEGLVKGGKMGLMKKEGNLRPNDKAMTKTKRGTKMTKMPTIQPGQTKVGELD